MYLGYDQVLDQKTVIREYPLEIWRGEKERESALLFKNLDLPGMAAVRDYFEEDGKGYAVSICPEGETLETYLDRGKKFGEEEASGCCSRRQRRWRPSMPWDWSAEILRPDIWYWERGDI